MTDSMVDIREAVVDDCLSLKNLIQELADYEKMSSGPKLDVDGEKLLFRNDRILKHEIQRGKL